MEDTIIKENVEKKPNIAVTKMEIRPEEELINKENKYEIFAKVRKLTDNESNNIQMITNTLIQNENMNQDIFVQSVRKLTDYARYNNKVVFVPKKVIVPVKKKIYISRRTGEVIRTEDLSNHQDLTTSVDQNALNYSTEAINYNTTITPEVNNYNYNYNTSISSELVNYETTPQVNYDTTSELVNYNTNVSSEFVNIDNNITPEYNYNTTEVNYDTTIQENTNTPNLIEPINLDIPYTSISQSVYPTDINNQNLLYSVHTEVDNDIYESAVPIKDMKEQTVTSNIINTQPVTTTYNYNIHPVSSLQSSILSKSIYTPRTYKARSLSARRRIF